MRAVLRASVICWGVVVAFFLFFLLPLEALGPVAAALLSVALGGGLLAWLFFYVRRLHRTEGFDFGLFLVRKGSFWRLLSGAVGLALFVVGGLSLLAPSRITEQLEKGAMPLAAFLVVLFWFSLIFTFLGFTLVCYAQAVGYLRVRNFKHGAGSFAIAVLWLGFATLFCSLFLEVVNDNFLTLTGPTQNLLLGLFALAATVAGLCAGAFEDLEKLLPEEDIKGHIRNNPLRSRPS